MADRTPPFAEIAHIADDLFAGAGGWDLAAHGLGIHARGVEIMKEALATRAVAGLETIHNDVWTFEPDRKASGLIASPPCQTFSAAGKGSGRKALDDVLAAIWSGAYSDRQALRDVGEKVGDDRTALVLTPLHFAMTGGYRWLAWEQVPTVLPVWEACAEVLRADGWHVWTGLLNAEQYGVPQTRKRAFLLASRRGPVTPPAPTHSRYYSRTPGKLDRGVRKWVSMAEALGWSQFDLVGFPRAADRGESIEINGQQYRARDLREASHPAFVVGEKARSWTRWVLRNNSSANAAERSPEEPEPTLYFGQRSNYCAWEWRGEGEPPALADWAFNRPSTTIVGTFKPEVVAAPGYRTTISRQNAPDSVRVTVEEAGLLQSFPADWPWQGARGKQFLQCGNAVPPGLAVHALSAASGIAIETEEAVA